MMTLLHWIEHLPNLRFHHKRIQISTPLIVSHGYISFLPLNIKQLKSQQFLSSFLSPPRSLSLQRTPYLRCRDAEMLRKALREANLMFLMTPHPRWAACWLVSELVAKKGRRLWDAVQLRGVGWWGGRWIARSGSLYPDAPGGMDTFDCCADVRQMLRLWDGQFASMLPPADTWQHWNDVWTVNVWVPNWNSDFYGLTRKLCK